MAAARRARHQSRSNPRPSGARSPNQGFRALFHGSMSRSRAAATSAPAKFGMRPCGGNGKRATPSALSLSQTHRRAALLSAKPRAMTESGPARPGESQGSNPPQGKPPRSHRVAAFPPIGRERMLHAIGRAVARTQIQAEWGSDASKGDRRFESSSLQQRVACESDLWCSSEARGLLDRALSRARHMMGQYSPVHSRSVAVRKIRRGHAGQMPNEQQL
jgi:hypothetical protein